MIILEMCLIIYNRVACEFLPGLHICLTSADVADPPRGILPFIALFSHWVTRCQTTEIPSSGEIYVYFSQQNSN